MLKLYGFGRVNKVARGNTRDLRVLWALEEMQVPFELVGIDHPKHELETDEFRAMNPFLQLPVIVDDGVVISESGAILVYLANKTGKLIAKDPAGEAQVLRWCFAALSSVEIPLLALQFTGWVDKSEGSPAKKGFTEFAQRHLGNLDRWLTGREFVAVDQFTVADILMAHVIGVEAHAKLVERYPHVHAYVERCKARPAWQRVIAAYCERVEAA
jgi:glutathione S-transferase